MANCATVSNKENTKPMRTSVHRQIEVPVSCGAVHSHSVGCCYCLQLAKAETAVDQEQYIEEKAQPNKFTKPKLNSVLRQVEEIESLQLRAQKMSKLKTTDELTPRSKAIIAPKITQKLNFRSSETVFKNLLPINVNDSILLPQKASSIRKKYVKATKVVAPDLCDFLTPLPPLTHVIPEPNILLEFPSHNFDYYGSFLRLHE